MKAPNVISVAAIVGLIALCQGLAETLPVLGQPWLFVCAVAVGTALGMIHMVAWPGRKQ